ncbi:MAG: glycosyltransferase [Thermodesulfobacteriota bacterium]
MNHLLDIITITKDDLDGVAATVASTDRLRRFPGCGQIVIDGSSEGVRERVGLLAAGGSNLEYCRQPPAGISAAFNEGLRRSSAEWIWFLNGGDTVHPGISPELLLPLLENSTADAMIFKIEFLETGKIPDHPPLWLRWPPVWSWIPHPAAIVRRNLLTRFGAFDESYRIAMDYEFWFRAFAGNAVVDTISIPLSRFTMNGLSDSQWPQTCAEAARVIRGNLRPLLKIWLRNGASIFSAWLHYYRQSSRRW